VTSARPFIAVAAYHLAHDRVARWPRGGYGVPAPYVDRLRAAGARVGIVAPGEPGVAEDLLRPFDGFMLVGGGDVEPRRYGAETGDTLYGIEPDRDAFEIDLLLAAGHMRLPILCICRGLQVLNIAFGGTLHQHLPDLAGLLPHGVPVDETEALHDVAVEIGTKLHHAVGTSSLTCSSHHHQGVDRIGDGLRVCGRSSDGLVEALEVVGDHHDDTWTLGVQWHPEDTAERDPAQQRLFGEFVRRAGSDEPPA
jgi:putative glutamine amidotransferase